jgi:hypothetical protein
VLHERSSDGRHHGRERALHSGSESGTLRQP